jgi:hypothetical protein
LKANTKEILRATMHEEINAVVKESLIEADYDEEDVETMDTELETGEEGGEMAPEVPALPMDDEGGDGEEFAPEVPEMGGEEFDTLDLTSASDDEVISVFKKLGGEDEIEIVSDTEVKIKDPQSGNEYVVKLGGGEPTEMAPEMEPEMEPEMGGEEAEFELTMGDEEEAPVAPEMGGEETPEELEGDDDDVTEEGVVYEIELQEMENIGRDIKSTGNPRDKGHDKGDEVNAGTMPSGDIEGTKAPVGSKAKDNWAGDNLEGGFVEDANGKNGNHAEHVMETEDMTDAPAAPKATPGEEKGPKPDGHAEHVMEEEEPIEEKISVGQGMSVGNHRNKTVDTTGAPQNPKRKGTNESQDAVKAEVIKRYNALLSEVKALRQERGEFKANLGKFRDMLAEAVVYNSNLTYVVKLFTEHSTTKAEKENIMKRFDGEVTSLKESKKLYKTLANDLASKKTITESIIDKTNKTQASSTSQLSESTAYVDQSTKRIIDLINRVETR